MIRNVREEETITEQQLASRYVFTEMNPPRIGLDGPFQVSRVSGERVYIDAFQKFLPFTGAARDEDDRVAAGFIPISSIRWICDDIPDVNAVITNIRLFELDYRAAKEVFEERMNRLVLGRSDQP